jgi:hypothetical protein
VITNKLRFDRISRLRAAFSLFACLLASSACAQSLCRPGETVYFSCRVAGSQKTASVCGDATRDADPFLQYRFGTNRRIELEYPATRLDSLKRFSFHRLMSKPDNSLIYELSFKNGSYYYMVVSEFADNDERKVDEKSIQVFDRDPWNAMPIVSLRCKDHIQETFFDLLGSPLNEHGVLPEH